MVLFVIAGTALVMIPLLIGRLVRPTLPTPEKDAVYECGEPTIGSSFIQWDLRFYTVALLFIVFDVEVAFFFPWATLYGGTMQLLNQVPGTSASTGEVISSNDAFQLGVLAFSDILVFFGVLLVGFAYVWKRGDLEWVRAAVNTASQRAVHDP